MHMQAYGYVHDLNGYIELSTSTLVTDPDSESSCPRCYDSASTFDMTLQASHDHLQVWCACTCARAHCRFKFKCGWRLGAVPQLPRAAHTHTI